MSSDDKSADTKGVDERETDGDDDFEALKSWSAAKAASEKKTQYSADLPWSECEALAEAAGLMLCGRCRAGVSFARGCNAEGECYGTVCRTCSNAGLLCHDQAADQRPNDF